MKGNFKTCDRIAAGFCIAALLFVVAGGAIQIRSPFLKVSALQPLQSHEPAIQGTGFAPNAVYPTTPFPADRGNVAFYGSWIGSDKSTGSAYTRWFSVVPRFGSSLPVISTLAATTYSSNTPPLEPASNVCLFLRSSRPAKAGGFAKSHSRRATSRSNSALAPWIVPHPCRVGSAFPIHS